MTRDVRFTPRAIRELDRIDDWTRERFGARQARLYLDLFEARLSALAEGTAHIRQLSTLTGQADHAAVALLRVGEHFLILDLRTEIIRVVDIVHTRSDLMRIVPTDRETR